jgi:hypothetical protein
MNLERGYLKDRAMMVEAAAMEMMRNPEIKLGLNDLDNFEGEMLLPDQRKVDILGCVIGVKPAAIMKGWLEIGDLGKEKELGEIINRLGLEWVMKVESIERRFEVSLFVARDKETLGQLREASQQSPSDIRKLARLQGYPETGVEVMLGKREALREETVIGLARGDMAYMSFFAPPILSRKNHRQEVKDYSRLLMDSTQENLPKTYEKAVKRWNTIRND